jgi:GT2 family glycosyltransferase
LESLSAQARPPEEVIVVDSSAGTESERVTSAFSEVRYLRFPGGRRGMPAARNAGVRLARGEVVAFLDDDCEASPRWLSGLAEAYRDPGVDGVGGKVIDPVVTIGPVRRFLTSGEPWAEPDDGDPRPADVDFLQGGNMSFRREVLLGAGGFDPGYTGSNYREETDLCFRLRRQGRRLVYAPEAAVTHLRAPRADGVGRSPDDPGREFYHARNQTYFVLKSYGLAWRPLAFYLGRQTVQRTVAAARRPSARALAWWAAHLAGKVVGIVAGLRYWARRAGSGLSRGGR